MFPLNPLIVTCANTFTIKCIRWETHTYAQIHTHIQGWTCLLSWSIRNAIRTIGFPIVLHHFFIKVIGLISSPHYGNSTNVSYITHAPPVNTRALLMLQLHCSSSFTPLSPPTTPPCSPCARARVCVPSNHRHYHDQGWSTAPTES